MVIVFANKFSFGIKSNNVAKGLLSKPPFFLSFFLFCGKVFPSRCKENGTLQMFSMRFGVCLCKCNKHLFAFGNVNLCKCKRDLCCGK